MPKSTVFHGPNSYVRVPVIVPSALAVAYVGADWTWWDDEKRMLMFPSTEQIEKTIADLRSSSNATNRRALRGGICVEFKNNTKTTLIHRILHEHYILTQRTTGTPEAVASADAGDGNGGPRLPHV